jgi:hypothetical protein
VAACFKELQESGSDFAGFHLNCKL